MPARNKEIDKLYHRKHWYTLRAMVLARDPLCLICLANGDTPPKPSTVADHKIPHNGNFDLFCSMENLQGLCARHHGEKTAVSDHGFGNRSRAYIPTRKIGITGDVGPQFISGSIPQHVLDRALGGQKELDELLKDIPE
jgi:hypothetical protein